MGLHLEEVAHKRYASMLEHSAFTIGKTAVSFKGLFVAGTMTGFSGPAGTGAGLVINHLMNHPATPVKTARGLAKLSEFMARDPEHKITRAFIQGFHSPASTSPEAMENLINDSMAAVNLTESPIKRNTEDVIAKANSISSVIRSQIGDDAAEQFLSIVNSGDKDALAAFMDSMSKQEGAKEFIEDGIGFNGKVYSDEDVAQLLEEIESSDVSRLQKSQLKKQLRDTKQIPQMQQEPERFIKYQTRDKTKPSF